MFSSLLTVAEKVAVLFIMIGVGYACSKFRIVTQRGASQITTVLLYIVTPCLIVSSLQGTIGSVSMRDIAVAGGAAVLLQAAAIVISLLFFRDRDGQRKSVLQFSMIYSNCAFMGLPLVQAVLGKEGVVYASIYIAVFNVFVWTHGFAIMNKGEKVSIKKIVLNPGVIGLAVGLPLFAFSIHLPNVMNLPIDGFSSLNTPLAMLVIGGYIARVKFSEIFFDKDVYLATLCRLVLAPAVSLGVLWVLKPDPVVFMACMMLSSAPVAGNTVLFAAQYGSDVKLASKTVAITTLFSIVTMPAFAVLTRMIT